MLSIIEILYITLLLVYSMMLVLLSYGWLTSSSENKENTNSNRFSIIIPIRNEVNNLNALIRSIQKNEYPESQYEVIIVDDHSDDEPHEILSQFSHLTNFYLLRNEGFGKKQAILTGIKRAKFEYIITTDGDCVVPKKWIKSFNNQIIKKESVLISAPVEYKGNSVFTSLLNYEFLGLIGIGASSLKLGFPTMANGANLCFKKEVFKKIGGYGEGVKIASGDDELLLHKVAKLYPEKISFLKSRNSIVSTNPPVNLISFINQRVRWASKWKNYGSLKNALPPIFIFLFYVLQTMYFFWSGISSFSLLLLGGKMLVELLFMIPILFFFRKPVLLFNIVIVQLYYPIYIMIIGLRVLYSGKYIWKNRRVV